jgi:hypothetical protein
MLRGLMLLALIFTATGSLLFYRCQYGRGTGLFSATGVHQQRCRE